MIATKTTKGTGTALQATGAKTRSSTGLSGLTDVLRSRHPQAWVAKRITGTKIEAADVTGRCHPRRSS